MYSTVIQSYIYSFSDSFPSQITRCWVEFPVLYSRSLLFICFTYGSVYLSANPKLPIYPSPAQHPHTPCWQLLKRIYSWSSWVEGKGERGMACSQYTTFGILIMGCQSLKFHCYLFIHFLCPSTLVGVILSLLPSFLTSQKARAPMPLTHILSSGYM